MHPLPIISSILGWGYFFAWSASFYPQIYTNWKRKSVVGFSFDFLFLNIQGYLCYSAFNLILYFDPTIKEQYIKEHHTQDIPAKINDIIFSVHGFIICLLYTLQVLVYERGDQELSLITFVLSIILWSILVIIAVVCSTGVLIWLWFVQALGYFKMIITLTKYAPQVYLNYRRKSTIGWSIIGVLLDISGGLFSFGQMFCLAVYEHDWSAFEGGNIPKLGLAVISVLFDVIFIFQHYVLYRVVHKEEYNSTIQYVFVKKDKDPKLVTQ
eukprot:TRINITY_DN27_c0_g1_i1.p1 TRINITY_DN27_c0_g1~~TRINITY_DN27_c0_g1_i1.p1  ORF type:complete len:268 (-),score=16.83 TRINITY_DN27_c0_g1_i1:57-860(-)